MAATLYLAGFLVSEINHKLLGFRIRRFDSLLMAGIAFATLYAEIFSLFFPVAFSALLIYSLICLAVLIICRKKIAEHLRTIP